MNGSDVPPLLGGRGLVAHDLDDGGRTAGWAEIHYDAIRALHQLTLLVRPVPAAVVSDVLGDVGLAAHLLPDLLSHLAEGLAEASDAAECDIHDTCMALAEAGTTARHLAQQLRAARSPLAKYQPN